MRVVIAVLLALSPLALATAQPHYPGPPGPPPGAVAESVTYGYADVLRVNPIYEQFRNPPREECYDQPVRYRAPPGGNPAGGTVIGAIIGGVLGNQVGSGSGRTAATVAGAAIGGAVGNNVDRNNNSDGRTYESVERQCHPVDSGYQQRVIGYDVEYRYRGEVYMSRLQFDPGDRLRVRVSVTPEG